VKRNVAFILVRPLYAGNIGAAARALKNMGFSRLVLAEPRASPLDLEAHKFAVGASDLLKKARVFSSLKQAIADRQILIGTSCRTGKRRRNFVTLSELPALIAPVKKVGFLFGPEEGGLTNEEIALCHHVVTIPTNPRFSSLNLAQAVMVIAYELRKSFGCVPKKYPAPSPQPTATMDQVEGMFTHLETMLSSIGFFPHGNPFIVMRTLRNLFSRAGLTPREIRILRGICRQVLWLAERQRASRSP